MKHINKVISAVAVVSAVAAIALGVNLVNTTKKYEALFNYHDAECEYMRYENAEEMGEDFSYLITCHEATQYELDDYIQCSDEKGSYCTLEDMI